MRWKTLFWMLVAAFFLFVIAAILPTDPEREARKQQEARERQAAEAEDKPDRIAAWVMAQEFVNQKLKSPGTADYGWQNPEESVTETGENDFRISAWVDSQNSLGATIRTHFVCEIHYAGDDRWQLKRLEFSE